MNWITKKKKIKCRGVKGNINRGLQLPEADSPFLSLPHPSLSLRVPLSPFPLPLPFLIHHGIRRKSKKVRHIPWKRTNRYPSWHQHPPQQGCFPVYLSLPAMLCFTLTSPSSPRFCPLFCTLLPYRLFPQFCRSREYSLGLFRSRNPLVLPLQPPPSSYYAHRYWDRSTFCRD